MTVVTINSDDLKIINEIVKENNLNVFDILVDQSSGIGYNVDIEYECEINGRSAKVRIPVCGSEKW